jgi:transcriptional regulator with XRE-family HTH domain
LINQVDLIFLIKFNLLSLQSKKITEMEEQVERIKRIIDESRLNQAEFAEKVGVSASNLSQVLNPDRYARPPGDKLLKKILIAFPDINEDWLFNGQGLMKKSEATRMVVADSNDLFGHSSTPNLKNSGVNSSGGQVEDEKARKSGVKTGEKIIENPEFKTVTGSVAIERKIVQIIVYYSDNTFEVFGGGKTAKL